LPAFIIEKQTELNNERLIKKSSQGNQRAQKILYEKYIGLLYSVVFRYVKSETDAEDILLQAYLKIFNKLKDFEYLNEKAFVGWIKRIAINEALMFKRKDFSALFKVEDLSAAGDLMAVSPDLVGENELIEIIGELPDGYRTVFLLHVVDGYSHKEIAKNLKIAESTSRTQFFKARNLLQKKLGNYYGTAMGT